MKRVLVKNQKLQSALDWIHGWREVALCAFSILLVAILACIYLSL
jgi:hypothetical protein